MGSHSSKGWESGVSDAGDHPLKGLGEKKQLGFCWKEIREGKPVWLKMEEYQRTVW